jgi:hypothetical protein
LFDGIPDSVIGRFELLEGIEEGGISNARHSGATARRPSRRTRIERSRALVVSFPLSVLRERVRVIFKLERLSKFQNHPHPYPLAEYRERGKN